jgi:hypothetical protein
LIAPIDPQGLLDVHNLGSERDRRSLNNAKGAQIVKYYLERQMRSVFKKWRGETDLYMNEIRFKVRNQRLLLQKSRVLALISIKVTNEATMQRFLFRAFS